ncbi:MAG: DUF2267 domain-containing protein, partial [Geodermatophilales bacterium]|nr:DUF2267 domain-containing protein [Geodermatophilales bacterium]
DHGTWREARSSAPGGPSDRVLDVHRGGGVAGRMADSDEARRAVEAVVGAVAVALDEPGRAQLAAVLPGALRGAAEADGPVAPVEDDAALVVSVGSISGCPPERARFYAQSVLSTLVDLEPEVARAIRDRLPLTDDLFSPIDQGVTHVARGSRPGSAHDCSTGPTSTGSWAGCAAGTATSVGCDGPWSSRPTGYGRYGTPSPAPSGKWTTRRGWSSTGARSPSRCGRTPSTASPTWTCNSPAASTRRWRPSAPTGDPEPAGSRSRPGPSLLWVSSIARRARATRRGGRAAVPVARGAGRVPRRRPRRARRAGSGQRGRQRRRTRLSSPAAPPRSLSDPCRPARDRG